MPSRATVRTGLVSTAALTLALLGAAPALADDAAPAFSVGKPCPDDLTLLPADLTCANGTIAPVEVAPPAEPAPDPSASDPAASNPPADPAPSASPTPDPTQPGIPAGGSGGGILAGGGGGSTDSGSGGTATGTGATGGGAATGGGSPATGSPASSTTTTDGSTAPGTSLHAAATSIDPATTTKSLLSAATASNLAGSDLPTLAAMRSLPVVPTLSGGLPLSAYTPSPLIANLPATTALSAVQAPLLAVGNDAAGSSGFTLAGLSSRALPGLLVVLATALVAAVGAGNLRYWQERFGTRH
jgi:hypothetical protein